MKKITLLTALLFSAALSAQITYLASDYANAGEEMTISKAPMFPGIVNFTTTGAGYSWDFSNLSADSQTTFSYGNPNDSGYKISWCFTHGYLFNCNSQFNNNFNLSLPISEGFEVQQYGITNMIEHSKLSSSSLETKMVGMTVGFGSLALPMAVDYQSPDVIYRFPMVYGDTYTSNAAFDVDLSSVGFPATYHATIERTNTVEGWGSLVTPYMTFPNVLKMKTVVEREDQITINGMTIPIPSTVVSYKWFDKNYGQPVLQADGTEVAGIFIPFSVTYIDGPQCLTPSAQFSMIPFGNDYNPETQSATVGFANLSTNFDSVSWNFGDGETATELNPSHTFTCPGIHDVTLTITNAFCNPVLTNSITIPIEITDSQNSFATSVSVDNAILTADRNLPGTTYQWVDCDNNNMPIEGATNQSFTAAVSGNYACLLTSNGCESQTDCVNVQVLQNNSFETDNQLVLLPNPTNGKLQLSKNIAVEKTEIFNALGMLVGTTLDLTSQPSGMYIIRITTDNGAFTSKIIKN